MEELAQRARERARAILLVDGLIGTRAPLAALLRAASYQVFEAATSDEALALLNSRLEIDALVAHAQVGGSMDGMALADWVRKTRPLLRVLVVADPADPEALLAMLPAVAPRP